MTLRVFTIDDKIAALHLELDEARRLERPSGSAAQRHYEVLKAIGADFRARQGLPRNGALCELTAEIERVKKTGGREGGYDHGRLVALANLLISKWPLVSQALERFAEEHAE